MRITSFAALVLFATFTAAQEKRDVPTFRSQVELVTVDAVVVDGAGRPVRGLSADDFTLREDGKPQAIASFEAVALGEDESEEEASTGVSGPVATNVRPRRAGARVFILLVDDLSLAPPRALDVRKALETFLQKSLRDGDELIFTTSSGDAWWSTRLPEGREDVQALVARVQGRNLLDTAPDYESEWEGYRINNYEAVGGLEGGPPAPPAAAGPPSTTPVPTLLAPGSNITQRVFDRFMARGVCDPRAASMCYTLVRGRAQQVDERRRNRTRDVLQAVDRANFALTGMRGRKSLLLLTEGFLNDPALTAVQEVASRCREANIAVYSIDVRGLMSGVGGYSADEPNAPNTVEQGMIQMEETDFISAGSVGLAEDTGGFAVRNSNDLAGGTARVADESRVYYLLGYVPPEGKGSRDWRKLKVEVKRPGLTVRARKGYALRTSAEIAGTPASKKAAKPGKDKPGKKGEAGAVLAAPVSIDVARALASAHDDDAIPLRAMVYTFDERPGGTVRTMLALEADRRSFTGAAGEENPKTVLSLIIAATNRESGKTLRFDQRLEVDAGAARAAEGWLALSRELELPPGVTQVRVVVRDETRGRLGAVSLRFEVLPPTGLRVSTPILTPQVSPGKEGAPPQPVLVAHREFAATGRLYCQFQVLGAATPLVVGPQVEAAYVLRRGTGEVIRRSAPTLIAPSPDGRLVRLLGLSLDGLEVGDYELIVTVLDKATGETRERVEPLRLIGGPG